jgi:hypothetical protein
MAAGTGHGEKRTRSREKAIAALLTHPTVKGAAKAAKVGERTLQLWLQDAEFLAAYRGARQKVLEVALSALQGATRQAVAALGRNLKCGKPPVEVKAAAVVLAQAVRSAELLDLQERLAELERQVKGGPGR